MTLPHRLSFSAQLSNCNVATRWSIELSILSLLRPSFNIHLSNRFNCSVKLFHLKIAIGLALGESWLLLVQPQKNTDVQCLPFPISVERLSLANLQKSPSSKPRMLSGKGFVFLRTADNSTCWNMLTHVSISSSTFSTFHSSDSSNGFMSCQGVRG